MKIGQKIELIGDENPYVISDTLTEEYTDITSVANWFKIGDLLFKDIIYIRDRIKEDLSNWSNYTEVEKKRCIKHFVYPDDFTQGQIDSYFSVEEQLLNWQNLIDVTKTARDGRWESARQKISFYLTTLEVLDLYNSTKDYSVQYKDANLPYLILWITNDINVDLGIDFTTVGFAQKSYYTVDRKNILIDCLINGN